MSSKQIRERCSCLPSVFHGKPLVSPTRRTVVAKLELALQRSADPFSFEATSARGSFGTEVFVDSKSSSGIAANLLALRFGKTFQTVVGRIFASETQDHNLSVAKSYQS